MLICSRAFKIKDVKKIENSVYLVFDTLENLSTRTSSVDGILETNFEYDSCLGILVLKIISYRYYFEQWILIHITRKWLFLGIYIELDFDSMSLYECKPNVWRIEKYL